MPLQVEGVIEALAAERAQIPLDVRVALHVPIEQTLQREGLHADTANELVVGILGATVVAGAERVALIAAVAADTAAAIVVAVAMMTAAAVLLLLLLLLLTEYQMLLQRLLLR